MSEKRDIARAIMARSDFNTLSAENQQKIRRDAEAPDARGKEDESLQLSWPMAGKFAYNVGKRALKNVIVDPAKAAFAAGKEMLSDLSAPLPPPPASLSDLPEALHTIARKNPFLAPGFYAFDKLRSEDPNENPLLGMAQSMDEGFRAVPDQPTVYQKGAQAVGTLASPLTGPDTVENLKGLTDPATLPESAANLTADISQFRTPYAKTGAGKLFNAATWLPSRLDPFTAGGWLARTINEASFKPVKGPGGETFRVPGYSTVLPESVIERQRRYGTVPEGELAAAVESLPKTSTGPSMAESTVSRLLASPTAQSKIHKLYAENTAAMTKELDKALEGPTAPLEVMGREAVRALAKKARDTHAQLGAQFDTIEQGPFREIKTNPTELAKTIDAIRAKYLREVKEMAIDRQIQDALYEKGEGKLDFDPETGILTDTSGSKPKKSVSLADLRILYKELSGLLSSRGTQQFGNNAQLRSEIAKLTEQVRDEIHDKLDESAPDTAVQWDDITRQYKQFHDVQAALEDARLHPTDFTVAGTGGRDHGPPLLMGAEKFAERAGGSKVPIEGVRALGTQLSPQAVPYLQKRVLRRELGGDAFTGPYNPLEPSLSPGSVMSDPDAFWDGTTVGEKIYDRESRLRESMPRKDVDALMELARIAKAIDQKKAATLNSMTMAELGKKGPKSTRFWDIPLAWVITNPEAVMFTTQAYKFLESGNMRMARASMTAAQRSVEKEQNREKALLGPEEGAPP